MTNERIDHAAEAERIYAKVKSAETEIDSSLMMAAAQVHATLALAEQQRIANLIELGASAARQVAEGTTSLDDYLRFYAQINDEIREGLGL